MTYPIRIRSEIPSGYPRRTPTNERTYLRKTGARLMVSNGLVSEMASETEELA